MADARMLGKIRKLLAKAESTTSTAERDALTGKAAELISAYGIDEALLGARHPESWRPEKVVIDLDPPYAADKWTLLNSVCRPLGVRTVGTKRMVSARPVAYAHTVALFGMAADLDRAQLLYTSLLVQAMHGLAHERPGFTDPGNYYERERYRYEQRTGRIHPSTVAAHRRSWMAGFSGAVRERLRASEEHAARVRQESSAARDEPSTAVVLADRTALVDAAVAAEFPHLTTSRRSLSSPSGYGSGRAAGQRADLGRGRVGRRDRELSA